MGRKKVIAKEVVKRTEYGYLPVEPKTPRQAITTEQPVPVQQYAKQSKPKGTGFFSRRKKPKEPGDQLADELNDTADALEGM